jgi:hypothetical protein
MILERPFSRLLAASCYQPESQTTTSACSVESTLARREWPRSIKALSGIILPVHPIYRSLKHGRHVVVVCPKGN